MQKTEQKETIKKGLLLLGSFAIACDLTIFLHELSHGLAAILTGGSFSGIIMNPFSWSYCQSFSMNRLVHIPAGALGAIIISVLIFSILYRWSHARLLPLLLMGPIALIDNGAYYVVDILMHSGGDACSLIALGIPAAVLGAAGIAFVILGFILAVLLIRKTGLLTYNLKGRITILSIGIMPNAFAMLIWNAIFNPTEIALWTTYAIATTIFTVAFAAILVKLWAKETSNPKTVTWKSVIIINIAYLCLLVFWFVGPFSFLNNESENLFGTNIEHFTERPADFPDVMTAPPYATDVSYSRLTSTIGDRRSFTYNIPESTPYDQIRNYITDIHQEKNYALLPYLSDDPNEIDYSDWTEKTDTTFGVPIKTKQYRQQWVKITPQPHSSCIAVVYMWKKDKFQTAHVINTSMEYTKAKDIEELYHNVISDPGQFDPNEIEFLENLILVKKKAAIDPNRVDSQAVELSDLNQSHKP